jgi:chromate transporter
MTMIEEAADRHSAAPPEATRPTWAEAQGAFARIGLLSFGGPAAQIALMQRILVDEKKWLGDKQFLSALSFCMLLPGPEAMQLATYAGWRLHGVAGGLMAGLWFVLPGAAVVLALSAIYAAFGQVPIVEALFFGIKAAVLVIVIEALLRVAKRALKATWHWALAGAAFLAIFFAAVPFPLIIAIAGLLGFLLATKTVATLVAPPAVPVTSTVRTILVWLVVWFAPLLAIAAIFGQGHVLSQLGWFFSKLAVVTFGGAYAVLAYMGQAVVQQFGWLTAGEMMTGLGLAETTPGPLILVTQFVGFLAAFKQEGWMIGLLGAVVALWATFAPCFLWIFAGAPYVGWLTGQLRLQGALSAITAAVVGVILNLAVWFGLHVLFKTVTPVAAGPLTLWWPAWQTLDPRALLIALVAAALLLWRHWSIVAVLAVAAVTAVALQFAGLR